MITKLDFVAAATQDAERSRRFYRGPWARVRRRAVV
jgi:catechol 2,3-dioxygenase-like lactoylglutathione lyase family enzyme